MTAPSPEFLDAALAVALKAADAAEIVVARHYRAHFDVEIKADASPVTIADREAEQAILTVIHASYPDHAVYGEEFGRSGDSDFLWLVDPIDGTKAFVRGYPVFSTQIALMYRGELMLGVSSAGQFGERAWARRAVTRICKGVSMNRKTWGALAGLLLAAASWAQESMPVMELTAGTLRWRGAVDAVIESDVNILDIAALAVIVREAGALVTELNGSALTLDTRTVLAAVPALHDELRARLC